MAEEPSTTSQSPPHNRRSSLAGQTLSDLFNSNRSSAPRSANNDSQYQGPITTAAAAAQRRRLSLSTLGLSGSPNSTSPYSSFRGRGESISSAGNSSLDESAIEDEPRDGATASQPGTPFARRMSFGARAMRDIRSSTGGNGNANGSVSAGGGAGSPGQNGRYSPASTTPPGRGLGRAPSVSLAGNGNANNNGTISARDVKGRGEGFNWSDNLRTRAERGSIAGGVGLPAGANQHARAKSVATMEPPPVQQEPPRPAPSMKPDHFQERILKGDFYMD